MLIKRLKNMSGDEFISKILQGERNLKRVRVKRIDARYFKDLEEYYSSDVVHGESGYEQNTLRKNPINISNSDFSELRIINPINGFKGEYLYKEHFYLSYIIGKNVNFQNARFSRTCFAYADLENADFSNARLEALGFQHANLKNTKFHKSFVHYVYFNGANLQGATFTNSVASSARFVDADFRNADVQGSNFHGADFTRADLRNVKNLEKCLHIGTAKFEKTKITSKEEMIIKPNLPPPPKKFQVFLA